MSNASLRLVANRSLTLSPDTAHLDGDAGDAVLLAAPAEPAGDPVVRSYLRFQLIGIEI